MVEVAPIRYPSAIELLRMKRGVGYLKFPDDRRGMSFSWLMLGMTPIGHNLFQVE